MMVDCRDCIHFEACLKKIKRTKKFSETAPDEYFSHDDGCIYFINAADIVPKSEVVLASSDAVKMLIECHGYALTHDSDVKREVAREIFAEIEEVFRQHTEGGYYLNGAWFPERLDLYTGNAIVELKKKYT
jgi:hypothetical protein